jgi:hypothetical protein
MSSLKLFFYFLKALHHNFFQLWSDDTSSLLSISSPPFLCLDLAKRGLIQSITCQDILDEFHEKLITKFCYSSDRAMIACQDFQQYSEIINITNQLQVVEQDHDDDMVIADSELVCVFLYF